MKGRRQRKTNEYYRWLREMEREMERLELLWSLGVVKNRDERLYRSEVEPYCYNDLEFTMDILRIIR